MCTGQDPADWTWMGVDRHGSTTTHSVNAFTAVEQVRRMDPYGNPRGPQPQTWPGQQGFVGGVHDPTGLIHVGARSYDPSTGRFLSVDLILATGDNQQINGYVYAYNNPVTFTDPTGLIPMCTPDAYNICADYSVEGTPTVGGRRGNHDPLAHYKPRDMGFEGGNDTWWSVDHTGDMNINGLDIPYGTLTGGSPAAIARLIDQVMAAYGMEAAPAQTYEAIIWLCDSGDLHCDSEYFDWRASVAWSLTGTPDADFVEVLLIGGSMAPGVGGMGVIRPPTRRNPCHNSFSADTHVLMADGTTKPIEQVEVGDIVLATDPESGQTEPKQVIATIVGEGDKDLARVTVGIQGPAPYDVENVVVATGGHPFWVTSTDQWTDAADLQVGQWLQTSTAAEVPITAIEQYTQ